MKIAKENGWKHPMNEQHVKTTDFFTSIVIIFLQKKDRKTGKRTRRLEFLKAY